GKRRPAAADVSVRFVLRGFRRRLRVGRRLQIVNGLSEAVVPGTGHLPLQIVEGDPEVFRRVKRRDELALVPESLGRVGQRGPRGRERRQLGRQGGVRGEVGDGRRRPGVAVIAVGIAGRVHAAFRGGVVAAWRVRGGRVGNGARPVIGGAGKRRR